MIAPTLSCVLFIIAEWSLILELVLLKKVAYCQPLTIGSHHGATDSQGRFDPALLPFFAPYLSKEEQRVVKESRDGPQPVPRSATDRLPDNVVVASVV
jgi:hypothetical protein